MPVDLNGDEIENLAAPVCPLGRNVGEGTA